MSKRKGDNTSYGLMVHDVKRARARSCCGSWASLPAEICLTILEEISRQKYRGWTSCAAVCKYWQVFVERKNFRRLTLEVSCLDELKHMVIRQRDLVQHICLNIELPRYTCRSCRQTESGSWISRHSSIMRNAMVKLYSVLSTWQPAGRLILEIAAYSPSDSQHWFTNFCFGPENDYYEGDFVLSQKASTSRWHDPNHGWVNGQQVEEPCAPAVLRLFCPLCLIPPNDLPEVHAVTGIMIRRQVRRQIFPPTLRLLCERLPRLESIVYEPWRVWQPPWKVMHDEGTHCLLGKTALLTVTTVAGLAPKPEVPVRGPETRAHGLSAPAGGVVPSHHRREVPTPPRPLHQKQPGFLRLRWQRRRHAQIEAPA
ncbi:hypothetical protein ACJ72_07347 [Emergomyces africanus]|uniref:F-box domain-containing protein n=1 Tax=Emergomyces africanus TaxID=1955775 RepID=A0A1B7NNI9_9EURO|nr:hypothetical protein ACJ72_07347 [Emergomyces africanus]